MTRHHRRPRATQPDTPAVRVVATTSTTRRTHWLQAIRNHHPNVAVISLTGREYASENARALLVLEGIGKRVGGFELTRRAELLAPAWLAHGNITDAVIADTPIDCDTALGAFIELFTLAHIPTTILVQHTHTAASKKRAHERIERLCNDWGAVVGTVEDLHARYPATTTAPPAADTPSGLPTLPRCDGIVFRSTCRDQLTPHDFARIDQEYVATVQDLVAAFNAADGDTGTVRRTVATSIAELLDTATGTEHVLLRARAAQVAGLRTGFLIKVDTTALIAAAETRPRTGTIDTPDVWAALESYRDPDIGVAAALNLAGIDTTQFAQLTLADINDTGTAITVAGRVLSARSHRFVRVLRTFRQFEGATADSYLFSTHRASRVQPRFGYKLLTATTPETGLVLIDSKAPDRSTSPEAWLQYYGIGLDMLSRGPRT